MSYPLPIVLAMKIRQAYRYELDPNNCQKTALAQHAGAARYAYYWGLADPSALPRRPSGTWTEP